MVNFPRTLSALTDFFGLMLLFQRERSAQFGSNTKIRVLIGVVPNSHSDRPVHRRIMSNCLILILGLLLVEEKRHKIEIRTVNQRCARGYSQDTH